MFHTIIPARSCRWLGGRSAAVGAGIGTMVENGECRVSTHGHLTSPASSSRGQSTCEGSAYLTLGHPTAAEPSHLLGVPPPRRSSCRARRLSGRPVISHSRRPRLRSPVRSGAQINPARRRGGEGLPRHGTGADDKRRMERDWGGWGTGWKRAGIGVETVAESRDWSWIGHRLGLETGQDLTENRLETY